MELNLENDLTQSIQRLRNHNAEIIGETNEPLLMVMSDSGFTILRLLKKIEIRADRRRQRKKVRGWL